MDIAFRVRNVEVPESLRCVTREKVTRVAGLCGITRADVCFSEQRNPRITQRAMCEITLWGPGRVLRAQAAATDCALAADRVVGKLEQRADRLRGRLRGRRFPRRCAASLPATAVGAGSVHFTARWSAVGRNHSAVDHRAVDHIKGDAGQSADTGISDSKTEPMTPEEAALEMGEQGSDIFVFVNAESGRTAVVYRRTDGDIAVADAPRTPADLTPADLTPADMRS